MNRPTILFITTDLSGLTPWPHTLSQAGYQTQVEKAFPDLLYQLETHTFELVLLDTNELDPDLLTQIQSIRNRFANPLLILGEERRESILVKAYQCGIDEIICKPIGGQLLIAKVNAWLHRAWNVPVGVLDPLIVGAFTLDPAAHCLLRNNHPAIKLTNLEFRLLHLLMSKAGRCLETKIIIDRVWGFSGEGDSHVLKHLVYRLRRKLETNPARPIHLQTCPGEGYAFYP